MPEPAVVIIGLGYVGLPLAREALAAGHDVIGLDLSEERVDGLNSGRSHIDDMSAADVADMVASGFRATTDPACIAGASVVVICVPTPLSLDGSPDLTAVESAARAVSRRMRPGTLVVLESTTYPGTTEEVLVPILEGSGLTLGEGFSCAFSPERIDPGNGSYGLRNTPKVVGGVTPRCTERAADFYGTVVDEVVIAKGVREAEMTKLLENTYRHVNIALVNEMARFCHELDIDLWDAIRCASTKPFGFSAFYPGPGVGGHCIPIDPNYLSHRVRTNLGQPFRFVELAQEINDSMPAYVCRRTQDMLNEQGVAMKGSRVLLVGVTYKADIMDQRESPAVDVALGLTALGADVSYHDPHVESWEIEGRPITRWTHLPQTCGDCDAVVIVQAHSSVDLAVLSHSGIPVLDTRGVLDGPGVVRL